MLRKFTFRNPTKTLPFTGERYTSGASGEIKHEHFHRYLFALQFCRQKEVLDIACGEGYGSALLGQVARQVTGVDLDPDTIRHAQASYSGKAVSFTVGDCSSIPLADASVDVVVSFETLEHIAEQKKFFLEITRVLRPDGVLVLSTPNRDAYAELATTPNPFHVKELSEEELRGFLRGSFLNHRLFGQRAVVGSAISPDSLSLDGADRQQFFKAESDGEVTVSPGIGAPIYFLAVASDVAIPAIEHGLLDDRPFLLGLYSLLQERDISKLQLKHELRLSEEDHRRQLQEVEKLRVDNGVLLEAERTTRLQLESARADRGKLEEQSEGLRRMLLSNQAQQLATDELRKNEAAQFHAKLADETAQFNAKLANEAAQFNAKLARTYRSLSWRLTRPVRAIENTVKFLKRKSREFSKRPAAGAFETNIDHSTELLRDDVVTLQHSGLFDEAYYFSRYPDVAAAGVSAIDHFLTTGALEGRFPNRLFDPLFYLSTYPDIAAAGINPLFHYITNGAAEGRNPSAGFGTAFYLATNPDVARSGMNPLVHYLRFGELEGRLARPPQPHSLASSDQANDLDPHREAKFIRRVKALRQTKFAYQPLISILVPTYNVPPNYLDAAVQSVLAQVYPNWELHLVDDGSTSAATLDALLAIEALDERILVRRLPKNGGISAATNTALREARGEYVAMLDHDDELTIDALHEVVRALNADPSIDVIYTDQDYVSPEGVPVRQLLKPDWSPELFRGVMFVGHLLVARRHLALETGGFDSNFDFVQDFEFMLRLSERTKKILHIPKILYHWRCLPTSVAGGGKTEEGIEKLQAKAVQAHLERLQLGGLVKPSPRHAHRTVIEPNSSAREITVDLFVHTGAGAHGSAAMVDASLALSGRPILQCIVPLGWDVDKMANVRSAAALDSNGAKRKLSEVDRLCQLLSKSEAEFVLVMSADLAITDPDWLNYLLLPTQEPDVAAVCAILLSKEGVVEHAGAVVGTDGRISSSMRGFQPDSDGYAGSLSCTREISACWADLVALRRSAVAPLLPPSPIYSTVDFMVADLALRATRSGFRTICSPRVKARLSGPREVDGIRDLDDVIFADVWSEKAKGDPFYNPSFGSDRIDYT